MLCQGDNYFCQGLNKITLLDLFKLMQIRLAKHADIQWIQQIFLHAKQIMASIGNSHQWKENYPSIELIQQDISHKNCYVCIKDNEIIGTFSCIKGEDPTYLHIENGDWLNNEAYITLHRIATKGVVKGLTAFIFDWCFKKHPNIRIDTHQDNTIMRYILEKEGFQECGVIYVDDGSPRIAYQKSI